MAVVGVGRIGLIHSENLAHRVRGARLAAVTTSRPEQATRARLAWGPVDVSPNLEALLAAGELDAVVIASSTSAHAENGESCAATGVHMLCEKPPALTPSESDRTVAAVASAGVKLMIGHVRRFDAGYIEAKRPIEAGAIGQPVVSRGISGDTAPPVPDFADPAVSGGPGCHPFHPFRQCGGVRHGRRVMHIQHSPVARSLPSHVKDRNRGEGKCQTK